mmetsp:Transcript_33049/g.71919  ORF Transcript_33049/g.71919 Transcript_33049/m.71919 type:complete len:913 (-) Transcript_33049:6-2744(-)
MQSSIRGGRDRINVATYVKFLQRWKILVLVAWVALAALLLFLGAARLVSLTKDKFDPPEGSPSAIAERKFVHYFGQDLNGTDVLFFEAAPGHSILEGDFLARVTNSSEAYLKRTLDPELLKDLSCVGYESLMQRGSPFNAGAASFVAKDNSSSFILVTYPKHRGRKYGRALQDVVKLLRQDYVTAEDSCFIGAGGAATAGIEATNAASKSIEGMDSMSVPFALAIFAISLKSVRLLVLPVITLVLSIGVSFGFLNLLARAGFIVSASAPPVVMSILLAITVDYALFLLSRFKEEIQSGAGVPTAVHLMLLHSGTTICGSGVTLACCFLSLLFFPIGMLQSIGLSVIVGILTAIAVSLSVVPALILCFPRFFSNFDLWGCGCVRRICRRSLGSGGDLIIVADECAGDEPWPTFRPVAPSITVPRLLDDGLWSRWASFATSIPAFWAVLVIILAMSVPSFTTFMGFQKSMDTYLMTPRGAISTETMKHFGQSFSQGETGPYHLLLLPTNSDTVYDQGFWDSATWILQGVAKRYEGPSRTLGTIMSPMYTYNLQRSHPDQKVPLMAAEFLDPIRNDSSVCDLFQKNKSKACHNFIHTKNCPDLAPLAPALATILGMSASEVVEGCRIFQKLIATSMTAKRDALYATLTPSDIPGSKDAVAWATGERLALDSLDIHDGVEAHLAGVTPQVMDAIDAIYQKLPFIGGITLICCLLFLGLLLQSVAFAVVSVVLIGWSMAVVFALGVSVYQQGMFGPGAPAQIAGDGGLAWLVPALTFTVILGLGLDYDIFLLSRVCELRVSGLDDRAAIAGGVAKTGPVITSAGIIMAIAFSGLMASTIPMLNQVSLLLVVAVLLDTFFVRSWATPAIHAPLGRLNWWPRAVPPSHPEAPGERNLQNWPLAARESRTVTEPPTSRRL